jgi:CxxC-x17-CxxC domain-containing protein
MDLYKAKYSDKKFDRHSKSSQTSNRSFRDDEPSRSFRNSKEKRSSRDRYSRDERKSEMHTVTCADCGDECQIPFEPKFNRPVYCSECFRKNKPQESRDRYSRDERSPRDRYSRDERSPRDRYSRDERSPRDRYSRDERSPRDRYSRDERSPRDRYSRDERDSNQDNYRTSRSKSAKFLKKTESFYSNGSEKFYASLKEKLFEILGGKVCSSCGFKDERALGFNHVTDGDAFDSIRRSGFASSWGKYISEPELAKKDLRVLCLNCNEIRQPVTKTEYKKPKNPNKKSRYFPR